MEREVQMPLLEAMPAVWCTVFAFALLWLVFGRKCFAAVIIASTTALAAAVMGLPPWVQVILWCGIGLFVHIIFAWFQHEKRVISHCALVISRTQDGRDGTVLYQGGCHTASPGCQLAVMPPCGSVVQVFIYDNGHCIICPQ